MATPRKKLLSSERVVNNLEQFILTNNIDQAVRKFEQLEKNEQDFKHYCFRQVNGNSTTLFNKLRGIDDISVFYNIKTATLSSLQPKIRLFKVNHADYKLDASGQIDQGSVKQLPTPCYREFKFSDNFGFETAASVQEYLKFESTKPNYRNVGLESFMITQNGETHGVIENNIECKLSLTFKSLKDLNASPPGEPTLRYVDLILWPPSRFSKDTEMYNPSHYEIKVILGYTAPSAEQLQALNLSRREEEALRNIEKLDQVVSLGLYDYQLDIQENGSVKLTASYRGRLETVLGSNQVNIFQDTIAIGSSGDIEIQTGGDPKFNISTLYDTASKVKSISSDMKSSDCLSSDCKAKTDVLNLIKGDVMFATLFKLTLDELSQTLASVQLKKTSREAKTLEPANPAAPDHFFNWWKNDSNVEQMLSVIKNRVGLVKKSMLEGFIDSLVTGDDDPKTEGTDPGARTRVFMCEVPPEGALFADTASGRAAEGEAEGDGGAVDTGEGENTEVSVDSFNKAAQNAKTTIVTNIVDFTFKRATATTPGLEDIAKKAAADYDVSSHKAESESDSEGEDDDAEDVVSTPSWVVKSNFEGMKIFYVYLGDIIELACKNARVSALSVLDDEDDSRTIYPRDSYFKESELSAGLNYPLNKARILLGPLEYVADDGSTQKINLAKMPISLNSFKSWFINKILRRRRTQMPLGNFLVTLMNDLVIPSLGVGMPNSRKAPGTKANIISLTLPGKIDGSKPKIQGCSNEELPFYKDALDDQGRIIDTESSLFMEGYFKDAVRPRSTISAVKTSFDYMLFYITSHKDIIERRGDPVSDIEEGIYHFNIGSDQGLLRSMDFSRVALPFLQELRSEQAEDQGVDQLEQLKFPFDTNVNLVGTSLFVPGMFYYINPSLAGLGSVENAASLAYQMNLGGYHLVQQVSTNIAAGKFVTQIVGTQTAQGRR